MFPICKIEQIDPIDPIDPVDTMDPIDQIDAVESLGRSQGTGVLGVICLGWEACRAQRRFAIMFVCSFLLPFDKQSVRTLDLLHWKTGPAYVNHILNATAVTSYNRLMYLTK
jgi:hypothetical protein